MSNWFAKQLARIGLAGQDAEALASSSPAHGPIAILLVDDTPANIQVLMETLKPLGHKLLAAKDGESALAIARRAHPALILLDVMMPGIDGFEVCRRLKADAELSQAAVIFCSALDDTSAKVKGLELGAVDFVTKPFEPDEVLARVNAHLAAQLLARSLASRNQALARELAVATAEKQEALRRIDWALLGSSPALRQLRALIASGAEGSEPALIRSRPDCGAEAVARAIHAASPRRDCPFIALDAARLSGSSVGVEAPPFTRGGAAPSRLELADGGSLMIDRFERLGDDALSALADYVEYTRQEREAGRRPVPDTRLICVTALVEDKLPERIPSTLIYALLELQFKLPSLAERRDDLPALIEALLKRQAQGLGRELGGIDSESLKRLKAHSWPGNLRELEDVIGRSAAATAAGKAVGVDPALLQVGTPLGSYRLLRKLGAGGFGEVWEARHQLLARPAAVKLILGSSASDPETVERFRREAAATASLASPHTVTLFDFGVSEQGQFYYVMELLDGIDLERLAERYGMLSPARLAHFLVQACRSLGEAHHRGMVHRDIKPSNLFACRLGIEVDVLKVLDFGLVRRADAAEVRLTQQDTILGTPAFIAPEAAGGKPIEGRTDIYSLAASAWSLLAGRLPFESDNPIAMVMSHLNEPPPPLLDHAKDVPPELAEIVMAGLAKNPKDRPNALEMARALEATGLPQAWTEDQRQEWWNRFIPTPEKVASSNQPTRISQA